jgi:trehalose-6-phosphatase
MGKHVQLVEGRILKAIEDELGDDSQHDENFRMVISVGPNDSDDESGFSDNDDDEWITLRKIVDIGEGGNSDDPAPLQHSPGMSQLPYVL